ncbi:Ran GTPase-activating protein [Schistosoma japonicum]|uniref:Ran GTPase-activating protein n=2 Tax=Schistosoma japonicum TaxID=6182 RepID=A0A4Z2DQV5_SCHJA|nr:Ran GTPase-activating protein 1 [Schistosoma japonicum]TNN18924.1 Ran GTPase-activating protein [Schistosoma japonicum]
MVAGLNGYSEKTISFASRALKLDKAVDAKDIVSALASNLDAVCLNLSGNTLGIEAAEPIGIALGKNRLIRRCLFNDLFTGRLKSEIAPALKHLSTGLIASKSQITELDLSDNAFGPNGVVGITDLLASHTCHTLEILRMNNQGLGHEGCRHLAEALEKGRRLSRNQGLLLKTFSGGRNRLENVGAQMLSKVFCDMGSLEELSLYQNGIGIHGIDGVLSLVKVIKSNPNLRVLNLADNSLTPRGGEAIARALPSLVNLEELYLSDCILRSAGVKALASAFEDPDTTPNLRVLNLTGNEIKLSAGINLILSLGNKSHLELLDLNANEFGRSGVRSIIQTLDSVGLLHTLPSPNDKDSPNDESVIDESYLWAFDEDQGSDQEDGDEEINDSEEVGEDADEDYDDSTRSQYEDEDDERENYSDVTTLDQKESSGVNFSFREAFSKLGTSGCLTPQNENAQITKPGPFGRPSFGLFSGISQNPSDTTDAGMIRSKLWPFSGSGNLFNFGDNVNAKRNLFSPPILSNKIVDQVVEEKTLDEDKFRQLLNEALSNPNKETNRNCLLDFFASSNSYFKQPPIHPVIVLCSQTTSPENVVRLSLALSRSTSCQINPVSSSIMQLAIGLLASLFTDFNNKKNTDHYRTSCAINCLLVYLGAIKPEKDSEDWLNCSPHNTNNSMLKVNMQHYLRLTKTLIDYFGPQLIPSVCNCLTLFLSEQRQKEMQSESSSFVRQVYTSDGVHLRDDIIDSLEKQLSSMNLKHEMN